MPVRDKTTENTSDSKKHDLIQRYIEAGFLYVPLRKGTKRPHVTWEARDEIPTLEQAASWLKNWPDSDVAVLTGQRSSGLLILDVDPRNGGTREGLPETPYKVRTPSGGWHYWYRYERGEDSPKLPRCLCGNADDDCCGIDLKHDGGLAAVPPAADGGRTWQGPVPTSVDDLPRLQVRRVIRDESEIVEACRRVESASEGARNDTLNQRSYVVGCKIDNTYQGRARARLVEAGKRAGLGPQETEGTVDSGLGDGLRDAEDFQSLLPSEDYVVPDPYELVPDGVFKKQDNGPPARVTHGPLILSRRIVDVNDGTIRWALEFGDDREVVVNRAEGVNARKLVAYTDTGLPVTSTTAREVVDYLSALEAENDLPTERSTARLGWTGDGRFVAGADCDHTNVVTDGIDLSGYTTAGNLDGWREAVDLVADHPHALLFTFGALAAPLLDRLDRPSFLLNLSYETSSGKTTSLELAASAVGNPRPSSSLLTTWDTTVVGFERRASMLNGVPMFMDETSVGQDWLIERIIYELSSGQGRVRGKADGGLRDQGSWRTVALSTGEQPITSFRQRGGAAARVVDVHARPIPPGSQELIRKLRAATRENYGHAFRRFVDELPDRGGLAERYRDQSRELTAMAPNAVSARRADNLAVVKLAAELAAEAELVSHVPGDGFWRDLLTVSEADDKPRAALELVMEWLASEGSRFDPDREAQNEPTRGWAGIDYRQKVGGPTYVGFLPQQLRTYLEEAGFAPESVLRTWRDRGWTDCDDNRLTKRATVHGSRSRVVKLTPEALAEVGADQGGGS